MGQISAGGYLDWTNFTFMIINIYEEKLGTRPGY